MIELPQHHDLVDRLDWTGILRARSQGVPWEQLRSQTGLTALGQALVQDRTDMTQRLLNLEAPTHTTRLFDGTAFSPLWATLQRRQADNLNLLLQAGADPNEPEPENGQSPLLYACHIGWAEGTLLLVRAGVSPNARRPGNDETDPDFSEDPPARLWLRWLAHHPQDEAAVLGVLRTLLEGGADPSTPCDGGRTLQEWLVHHGHHSSGELKQDWIAVNQLACAQQGTGESFHLSQALPPVPSTRDRRL